MSNEMTDARAIEIVRSEDFQPFDLLSTAIEHLIGRTEEAARLRGEAAQPATFDRGRDTRRREKAVEAMLADGWNWDGDQWTRPPAAPAPVAGDAVSVDDAMVERVEQAVGMGHTAWDMVDPKELIRAALAQDRASQGGAAGVPEGLAVEAWRVISDPENCPDWSLNDCRFPSATPAGATMQAIVTGSRAGISALRKMLAAAPTPAAEREVG